MLYLVPDDPHSLPVSSQGKSIKPNYFNRGESITIENDSICLIEAGVVRTITWDQDGTTLAVLGLWGHGDLIGKPITKVEPIQFQCITKVVARPIPFQLWTQMTDSLLFHIYQVDQLLRILHLRPVKLRLLEALIWLSGKFGIDTNVGRLIDIRLCHRELAELISTSRVTVTRYMKEFYQSGHIDYDQRRRVILNPQFWQMSKL